MFLFKFLIHEHQLLDIKVTDTTFVFQILWQTTYSQSRLQFKKFSNTKLINVNLSWGVFKDFLYI